MKIEESYVIDPRLHKELQDLYDKLYADNKLVVGEKLQGYYEIFRKKFGPERLRVLEGEELLFAMKGGKQDDSLIYWLDFKRDAEFPPIFGEVAGGSAHKHGLFRKIDTQKWISGTPNNEKEVTQEQAIEIAREQRRQLIEGCELLDALSLESDEDYAVLQQEMNRVAPAVSDTAWGHKYFSLLYPDKLDDFHVSTYHYFHLLKLLQLPPADFGLYKSYKTGVRYLAADRFVRIASSLGIAVHTLTTLLNVRNGAPYTYWRLGTTGGRDGKSFWDEMRESNHCSIGWSGTGDLSTLVNLSKFSVINERKNRLREIISQLYPSDNAAVITRTVNQIYDFTFNMSKGDLVLASEGGKVRGIGQITGDYFYDATKGFPHCRSVKWLSTEEWRQVDQNPDIEGKLTTVYVMKRPLNLIEAERRILLGGEQSSGPGVDDGHVEGDPPPSPGPGGIAGPVIEIFADSKLVSIPEAQLKQRIARLQRSILVEEKLVRRIYYALLNGHVILAGPPGTGKTELARLIPEILWQDEQLELLDPDSSDSIEAVKHATPSGYTTMLVTATSEWSTHTLISSIVPVTQGERIIYRTRYGYLTEAIVRNWAINEQNTTQWEVLGRRSILAHTGPDQQEERQYRGNWLVIDEFNRAPIDAALGEAMTALSDGEALQIFIDGGRVLLPLPGDFRIIGTLNSFDRNYLNQISEALKRRFSFIEIPSPTRRYRLAEQGIVLYKALKHLAHHRPTTITITNEGITWNGVVSLYGNADGIYEITWPDEQHPFFHLFTHLLWPLFETLRVYRQLGTAQAIALTRQLLTQALLQDEATEDTWREMLDTAFCDTIADQLQVLLPDELEVLSWYLKFDAEKCIDKYSTMLVDLRGRKRRLIAHLEVLGTIVNEQGEPLLTDEDIEDVLEQEEPSILPEVLREAFHLDHAPYRLPEFARRLRNFKAVHGL